MVDPETWKAMSDYQRAQWRKTSPDECAALDRGEVAFAEVPARPRASPARTVAEATTDALALWERAFDRANGVTSSAPASNPADDLWTEAFRKMDEARLAADPGSNPGSTAPTAGSEDLWDRAYDAVARG
jgi:hypothetical protein